MMCERCGQRTATVKYIEVEEGEKRSRWICEVCAAEEGAQPPPGSEETAELEVTGFLDLDADPDPEGTGEELDPCPRCGTRFSALQGQGLLGCPGCYEHFREPLAQVLQRFHRARTHVGKAPRARGPRAQRRLRIAQLRAELETAVAAEDFEAAARVRDEIASLQTQVDEGGSDREDH